MMFEEFLGVSMRSLVIFEEFGRHGALSHEPKNVYKYRNLNIYVYHKFQAEDIHIELQFLGFQIVSS